MKVLVLPLLALMAASLSSRMDWLILPSSVAIVWGLGILIAIVLMRRLARDDRNRLLQIFVPGLYLTIVSAFCISAIHAVLATFLVFSVGVAPDGRVVMITTIAAGIVGLAGVAVLIVLIIGLFLTIRRAKTAVVGKLVTRSSCPRLFEYVEELAKKLDALVPDQVIVGLTPNFFVTEADVARLGVPLRGRTLFLSLPLCRILTEPELRAILGHELGHFRGEDTKFSQRFYPFYRGASESLAGSQGLIFFPAHVILSYFMEGFETQVRQIDRTRELAADQVGAEVAGGRSVASALVKIHAFEHYWSDTYDKVRDRLESGDSMANISRLFATRVAEEASPTHLVGLDEEILAHPTDTHPPLGARLDALGVKLSDITEEALAVSPKESAVEIVEDYESIEQELTNLETNFLVKSGQVVPIRGILCPSCGRENPMQRTSCECGFNFHRVGVG